MTMPAFLLPFENAVLRRDHYAACEVLIEWLETPEAARMNASGLRSICTRITANVIRLLTHPTWQPDHLHFRRLARARTTLTHIAGASAYGNLDEALLRVANTPVRSGDTNALVAKSLKMLLAFDLNSHVEFPFERIARAVPPAALACYFTLLSDPVVMTERAHALRQKLLDAVELFENETLEDFMIGPAVNAWFMCSYDDRADKHEFKRHVNNMIERWVAAAGVEPIVEWERDATRAKPLLLVAADVFKSTHAVYRCFGPLIRKASSAYEVVLMATPRQSDEAARSIADRFVPVDFDPSDVKRLVSLAREQSPDIVFFPSLGMSHWTVTLANTRVAPVQIASLGHPATTHSEHIDCLINEERYFGDPACYSEKLVFLREGSFQFAEHPEYNAKGEGGRGKGELPQGKGERGNGKGFVRIAVNSLAPKVTFPFLQTCARIGECADADVEFHFFTGLHPVATLHAQRIISATLAQAVVHPWCDYEAYLGNLAQCDMQLATFPFGGTNTIVDSFACGIPVVALRGAQPHSTIDSALITAAGLPDWLITSSIAEFEAAVLRLLNDTDELKTLRDQLKNEDLQAAFWDADYTEHPRDLVDTLDWIRENINLIRSDVRRVWTIEDREPRAVAV